VEIEELVEESEEEIIKETENLEELAETPLHEQALDYLKTKRVELSEDQVKMKSLEKQIEDVKKSISSLRLGMQGSGGGGAVKIKDMDDVDRSTALVDGKFLKYDSSLSKWVGADGGGSAVGITSASFETSDGVLTLTKSDNSTVTTDFDGRYAELSGATFTGDISFGDDVKAKFGDSNDLLIYHDTTSEAVGDGRSVIKDVGTNGLYLSSDGNGIFLENDSRQRALAAFTMPGTSPFIRLYYNNSSRLQTTNDGVEVTGDVEADEFIGDVRGAVLFKAKASEGLAKGDVVYIDQYDTTGNQTQVAKANASDAAKMPAFGIVSTAANANANVDVYTFGTLSGIDTSSFSINDELYVSASTAGVLVNTAPSGSANLIQKIAKVTRVHATSGSIKIMGAGRTNATPNLDDGDIFIGNSSNQAITGSLDTLVGNAGYKKTVSETDVTAHQSALSIDASTQVTGILPVSNMAATALTTIQTAADEAAQLALTTEEGDVVVRTDQNKTYMHNGGSAGTMADFTLLATPTDSVTSVDGNTGAVTTLQLGTTATTALAGNTSLLQLGTTSTTALAGDTSLLQLGTTSTTALAGNTSLLQLGTSSTTALAGDTALLQLGTSSTTALAGDTALLQLGTTSTTALAGDTSLLQLGTTGTTALAGDTALLELGTTSTTALAGDTALLELGTTSTTALAGDTALLALGTTSTTALAGDTSLLQIGTTATTAMAGNTALSAIGGSLDLSSQVTGTLPVSNMAATALTTVQTAASESAQLALTTEEGDVVVRTDENKTYMRNSGTTDPHDMTNFTLLATPTDAVTSVDGNTGAVTTLQIGTTATTAMAGNTTFDRIIKNDTSIIIVDDGNPPSLTNNITFNTAGATELQMSYANGIVMSGRDDKPITLGSSTKTGTITVGNSTKANTINIGDAATEGNTTQTINIASSGQSTSTTNVDIAAPTGSSSANTAVTIGGASATNTGGTHTIDINGNTTFTQLNSGGFFDIRYTTTPDHANPGIRCEGDGKITLFETVIRNSDNASYTGGGTITDYDKLESLVLESSGDSSRLSMYQTTGNSSSDTHDETIRFDSEGDSHISKPVAIGYIPSSTLGTVPLTLKGTQHNTPTSVAAFRILSNNNYSGVAGTTSNGSVIRAGSRIDTGGLSDINDSHGYILIESRLGSPASGSATKIQLNASPSARSEIAGNTAFTSHGSTDSGKVTVETTSTTTSTFPIIELVRTATVAEGSNIGSIQFNAPAVNGTPADYASISSSIIDHAYTSEDGSLKFNVALNGTMTEVFEVANDQGIPSVELKNNAILTVPSLLTTKTITTTQSHGNNTTTNDNIAIGANSGSTNVIKNVNIGTNFHNGGTTNINIGPTSNTTTKFINLNGNTAVNNANLTVTGTSGATIKANINTSGTSSSSGGLQVVNTSGTDSTTGLSCSNGTTQIDSYATLNGAAHDIKMHFGAGSEKFRFKGNGRLGIGTSVPAEALHVVGDIVATGNVTAYYSDERLKDLKGAIPDALDKVNKLTGYYYTPNALAHSLGVDNTELEVGVSAQEVEEVLPEIVTKSAVGQDEFGEDYKSVHYDKLTPLLIESIKELTKKVGELETKMKEMEK
jgi:hypothetical protein